MIKALDTATQGLLQAERRATDIAKDILKTTSEAASFSLDSENGPSANTVASTTDPASAPPSDHPGYGNLIQQFADLRAEQRAFEANAKVFKEVDETLGSLIDGIG